MRAFVMLMVMLCLLINGAGAPVAAQGNSPLLTRWGAALDPNYVLPEYPRPQLVRERWLNLNGSWEYAITDRIDTAPEVFWGEILVPFPIESILSGVQRQMSVGDRLWYRRRVEIPAGWGGERILLHFGAVDWQTVIYVNGVEVGTHQGGYDAFSFDITSALRDDGPEQELVVAVWDPTDIGLQPRGKQVNTPGGIWYTPSTGIWQTVWLEPVATTAHIEALKITPDIDAQTLLVAATVASDRPDLHLRAEVLANGELVSRITQSAAEALLLPVPDPILWTPDDPYLYDLRLTLLENDAIVDQVSSYFGMRKIDIRPGSDGIPRLYLNNAPVFSYGLLDQGFWPDGLYTAPTDEALRYDIEVTKQLGFNTIRKHVKVEPARWYYWADRLGVLVWQDMPSGDEMLGYDEGEIQRLAVSAQQFETELSALIDSHYNHPSIIMWVLFNEGWGQYDTARLTDWLQGYDPSRLVNSVSGWTDMQTGHVFDIHSYPGPDAPPVSAARAAVLGEFGGLGLPVEGHLWRESQHWGYQGFESVTALSDRYSNLIETLGELVQSHGLAAAIYTQTTDVETEVNGMLTYDRAIIKMDIAQVAHLNNGLYALLPD